MFIPDGSNVDYDGKATLNRYSWGWLGDTVPSTGWKSQKLKNEVLSRLKSFTPQIYHRGFHECEICLCHQEAGKQKAARNYEEWLERSKTAKHQVDIATFNGSYLIRYGKFTLRSPAGVEHYIEEHDYNPGPFVIEAILNGKEEHEKE